MKPRSKPGRFVVATVAFILAVVAVLLFGPREKESPHELGQKLLLAAEERNWTWAKTLLEEGADPNVTEFTPPKDPGPFWGWLYDHGLPNPDWRARIKPVIGSGSIIGLDWNRRSPLAEAMEQKNAEAIKQLLRYKADPVEPLLYALEYDFAQDQTEKVRLVLDAVGGWKPEFNAGVLDGARQDGTRDTINLVENAAHIPLFDRSVAQEPFAPGAEAAHAEVFPATVGAVPTRHLLWISPHELLVMEHAPNIAFRESPRFAIVDLDTGNITELPQLSESWTGRDFNPNMLTVSPDGKWLLGLSDGFWLATEIHGTGQQDWSRVKSSPHFSIQFYPLIAWLDNQHWIEVTMKDQVEVNGDDPQQKPHEVGRVRTLGDDKVVESPLQSNYPRGFDETLFTFSTPTEGWLQGDIDVYWDQKNLESIVYTANLARITQTPDSWNLEKREIVWNRTEHPGGFSRCVLSPDHKHLAWLNSFDKSGAWDILVSDIDGKNVSIVYEKLNAVGSVNERVEPPWYDMLEWTPRGDGLVFWCGAFGQNGLGLVRLTPGELR